MPLSQQEFDALKLRLLEKQNQKSSPVNEEKTGKDGTIKQVVKGAGKGVLSTLVGASGLGERLTKGLGRLITPKRFEKALGFEAPEKTGAEQLISEELRTPETTAEKVGFGIEQVAEFFVPGAKVGKLGKLAKAGVVGAEVAGRTALQTGDIGKEELIAGVTAPIVGGILSKAGAALFKKLPERLVRKAIGQSKKELLAGKDVSKFALDKKKFGTGQSILSESESQIETLSNKISANLKSIPVTQSKISVKNIADDVARKINEQGGNITTQEVRDIIIKLAPQAKGLLGKPTTGLLNANYLRQSVDKTLGDRGFLTAQLPFNKEVLRTFTNTLREQVKEKAPKGTRELFDDLSSEITLRNALTENLTKEQLSKGLGLTDIMVGLGFGAGGGIAPAIGAVGAKKVLESRPFLTGAGITLDQLSKLAPILEKLTPAERGAISQVIQQLLNKE